MNSDKNLWLLCLGCLISSISYTMLLPFLSLYLLELGAAESEIKTWSGLVFGATFLFSAIMSPIWGRYADRTGKRRMLIRAGLSLAGVYFLGSLVRSPLELLLMRALQGFATGFIPAAMAIVTSSVATAKLGFSLGLMQTSILIGSILGPLAGGGLAHVFGIRTSFTAAAIIILVATLLVWVLVKEPKQQLAVQAGGITDDLKTAWANPIIRQCLQLMMLAQAGIMVIQPLIPLHIAELLTTSTGVVLAAGVVFSATGIAGAIAAPVWGRLNQQYNYEVLLLIAFAGSGMIAVAPYFIDSFQLFAAIQFVFGLFISGIFPTLNTAVATNTAAAFRGRVFGLMMSANQVGSMLGPVLGGAVGNWLGIRAVFICVALLLLATAAKLAVKQRCCYNQRG